MNNLNLGQLIEGTQQRDAVHVAVAPVIAGDKLSPGDHVGIASGKAVESAVHIGVIDPFLKKTIKPGEQCWLFLYPGTITSLRHEWTHPAFSESVKEDTDVAASKAWISACARDCGGLDYEGIMQAAKDYLESGEYFSQGDRFEDVCLPGEFWTHYEIATGTRVGDTQRQSFFSCSC